MRPHLRSLIPVLLVLSVAGCEAISHDEQVEICQSNLAETPASLLIGSEGMEEVCTCTVDSLAVRFPDAPQRWVAYQAELDRRMESRGLLGLMADTAWANSEGKEMMTFAAAQGEIVAACTAQLFPR